MPLANRIREQKRSIYTGGHCQIGSATLFGKNGYSNYKHCQDSTDIPPYSDHELDLFSKVGTPCRYNGNLNASYRYFDYSPVDFTDDNSGAHVSSAIPSIGFLMTEVVRKGNPQSNPDVDILNFVYELKELPSALKNLGDSFLKGANWSGLSSFPISVQFGWKPLLADLRTMLKFAEQTNARLQKLREVGDEFSSSSIFLGSWDASDRLAYTRNGVGYWRERQTKTRAWATFRHRLSGARLPNWTYEDASNIAFSTRLSAATIWNSFPWTWLIDYLANVGNYLEAHRGQFRYEVKHANFMTNIKTEIRYVPYTTGGTLTSKVGTVNCESKRRTLRNSVTPRFAFQPIIGPEKWLNLAFLLLARTGSKRNPFNG